MRLLLRSERETRRLIVDCSGCCCRVVTSDVIVVADGVFLATDEGKGLVVVRVGRLIVG